MKKLFLIFLIIILFLLAMLLSSCNKELIHEEYTFPSYETLGLTGGEGDSTSIVFESEATFNVLEIIEEGNNIESFSLYKLVGDSYEHFYTQDFIGEFRYCSFPKISTTEIKITINEDIYRKLKSFGVLLGINDKEPILLGNTISKLYDLSKDKIFKEFI